MRFLCVIALILTLFGGRQVIKYDSIVNYFSEAQSVVIYTDGESQEYLSSSAEFVSIISALNNVCDGAREMPAFGVSLDTYTRKEMGSGLWLELKYNEAREYNDMPFMTLLINVHSDHTGINLIRQVKGKYDGRCYYLDLDHNMSELCECLESIAKR